MKGNAIYQLWAGLEPGLLYDLAGSVKSSVQDEVGQQAIQRGLWGPWPGLSVLRAACPASPPIQLDS